MPRPKHRSKLQHQPHCKYYQGEPLANAAIFDVRSQQEDAEAEARRSRLQLQRLPALTIRRQLQVQWGPTVSLPQPGEAPPTGPPPGHNVRLFEVRHGDAEIATSASAAPTFGQTFVLHKQGEAHSHRQPVTEPLKPVDVSPLRELPPEHPPAQAPPPPSLQPQPPLPPPVLPSPPPRPSSPPHGSSPARQQTSGVKPASRGRHGQHVAPRMARGQIMGMTITSARPSQLSVFRGASRSKVAPSPTPAGRSRAAAVYSPPRRSSACRGSPTRRPSPGAATAREPALGPSASLPGRDVAPTAARPPRRAPARVEVTATSLPPSVQGSVVPDTQPDALFRELSASAEARRAASTPTAEGPMGTEYEASLLGEMSMADVEGLAGRADAELDGEGDGGGDLWSTAQRIRRQQEVTDIEHRVLDLIGARVVAGLLNMDRKLVIEDWGQHRMEQPSLSDEVGEHRVLGEGISMEETEIRTPINYDDYLDQEPADNEAEYDGGEKAGSADGGSPDYEDDFEEEEEEPNHQESTPVSGDTREKELEVQKLASVPEIQVDSDSLKDDKSGQGTPEVNAAGPGRPAASSPPRGPRRLGAARAGGFPRRRRARSVRRNASPCTSGDPASKRRQPRR